MAEQKLCLGMTLGGGVVFCFSGGVVGFWGFWGVSGIHLNQQQLDT